jgi:peptidoglycan/LPS O-acetylase OafA/YrhL
MLHFTAEAPRAANHLRYIGLDALRGVAAISVMLHHIGQELSRANSGIRLPLGLFSNGYHAVDFFFMLSGFVIAAAYEPKMRDGMTFRHYAGLRLARLYPILAIGALVALLCLPFQPIAYHPGLALASQLTLIPFLAGGALLFPLNIVQWSIFYELAVNALHFFVLRRMSTGALVTTCLFAALGLVTVCWNGGSISGGWWLESAPVGVLRVVFGFCAGLLIHRHKDLLRVPSLPLALVALALVAVLASSPVPALWHVQDAIVVILILPIILIFAVRASVGLPRLASLAGGLSFPLYAVHLPIVTSAAFLTANSHPALAWLGILGSAGLSIALAAIIWRLLPKSFGGARRGGRRANSAAGLAFGTA